MTRTVEDDLIQIELRLHIAQARDGDLSESTRTIDLQAVDRDAFNVDYSADVVPDDAPLRRVVAEVVIESDRTWYLDDGGQLAELRSSATPLWPTGRFIVTTREGKFDRWEFPSFGRPRLSRESGSVHIVAPLLDRSSCGLSVWPHATWVDRREKITLQVSRTSLDRLEECAWIEPYPDGARAVICLTDHADFDSPEKARLLADHLVQRDIRITKTVFPAEDPPSSMPWKETGLDDASYRDSMDRLFDSGSEIAAHGFTPRRNAPSLAECKRRLELLRRYELTTWVDHGIGPYLFSRGGQLGEGAQLEPLLEEHGVENYWSYFDVWDNPFGKDFSVFSKRGGVDIVADFVDRNHGWTKTTAGEAAWFALHEFRNIVGDGPDAAIRRRPWQPAGWRRGFRWYGIARRVRRAPFGIYGRDGAVWQQSLESPWVFDSVLLNHLALQLAPTMIDRVIQKAELVIGHCYMTCEHDYARRNVFRRVDGRPEIDPAFETALDYLSDRQRSGELSTMSFAQVRRCLELFARARLRRTELGWTTEVADGASPYEARADGGRLDRTLEATTFTLPRRTLMEREIVAVH